MKGRSSTTTNHTHSFGQNGLNGRKQNDYSNVVQLYPTENLYAYLFIGLVAIVCYLNGLNGEFVHDDIPAITLNKDVVGKNKIANAFINDFWGTPMADANSHKSYRPLTVISFR